MFEALPENSIENEKDDSFDIISEKDIKEIVSKIEKENGLDFHDTDFHIIKPNTERYFLEEGKHLLINKYNYNEEELLEKVNKYGYDFDRIKKEELEDVLNKESLKTKDKLPGLALTDDKDILFFSIKPENLIDVANDYVFNNKKFNSLEEASDYLKSLSEEVLIHELGHRMWRKITSEKRKKWGEAIRDDYSLEQQIIEIQKKNYDNPIDIPFEDEAFADAFVNMITNQSRVNFSKDKIFLIKDILSNN